MNPTPDRFVLRNLPLASRLVLAAFLVSVGIGYCAALIQVHFQHASAGKLLPGPKDAANAYHGSSNLSQLERLLSADENRPFNGTGTMRQAFATKSAGWKNSIRKRAKEKNVSLAQAEEELRQEREGERLAILDWIRTGASQEAFEKSGHALPASLLNHSITAEFVDTGTEGVRRAKIDAIFEARCARCHSGGSSRASCYPLETWEQIHDYCEAEAVGGGMSLKKLAQSTHIHLLGFAMLYGLTGLAFSLTSYSRWVRGVLSPLPLVAQLADISLWWLARVDPVYAHAIVFTGGVVALSLFLQIGLGLFDLFGKSGKALMALLLIAGCLGAYVVKERVIDPYLTKEAAGAVSAD
jgi:hypothetical protein